MKNFKKVLLLTVILLFSANSHAFPDISEGKVKKNKNCVFAEFSYVSGYTINFEHFFKQNISSRIGYGYSNPSSKLPSFHYKETLIPISVSYLFNNNSNHKFELGAEFMIDYKHSSNRKINECKYFGYNLKNTDYTIITAVPVILAGYRFQPNNMNLTLRTGLNLMTFFPIPFPYLSVGYKF